MDRIGEGRRFACMHIQLAKEVLECNGLTFLEVQLDHLECLATTFVGVSGRCNAFQRRLGDLNR